MPLNLVFNMQTKKNNLHFWFVGWVFLVVAVLYLCFGYNYLYAIVSSSTLFKNLIFEYSSWYGKSLVVLFIATTYFSYLVFLAFLPFSLLFILTFFIKNSKALTLVTILVAYFALAWIIVDSKLYSMFKFHLNMQILGMLLTSNFRDLLDLSLVEIIIICSVACGLLFFLSFLACIIWKKILPKKFYIHAASLKHVNFAKNIALIWIGAALFSYFCLMLSIFTQNNNLLIQQVANLPFYNNFLAIVIPKKNAKDILNRYSEGTYMQAQFSHDALDYPKKPMICKQEPNKKFNIIFIMVDSLRQDSIQYMQNLAKFAKLNWNFLQHFSGGNATQSGLFTLFYSIPSAYWTAALQQKISPLFIDLLLANNYDSKVIWSSEMQNPPMDKTIYRKLNNLNPNKIYPNNLSLWDKSTTEEAINFLNKSRKNGTPFFLNIFYNAPHAFCRGQDFPLKYKPIAKECSRINMHNNSDPKPFYNSYLNTIDFTDLEIKKVLDAIAINGLLENSIIIITSDHGQEFNENHLNYWGHASNYSKYQVQVPFIMHWPHTNPKVFQHLTTHYDVMPTLLSRVFDCKNVPKDYSIGKDLLVTNQQQTFILVGSYVNSGIIEKNRITTLHVSGETSITDLNLQPLVAEKPNLDVLKKSLLLLRYYYKKSG